MRSFGWIVCTIAFALLGCDVSADPQSTSPRQMDLDVSQSFDSRSFDFSHEREITLTQKGESQLISSIQSAGLLRLVEEEAGALRGQIAFDSFAHEENGGPSRNQRALLASLSLPFRVQLREDGGLVSVETAGQLDAVAEGYLLQLLQEPFPATDGEAAQHSWQAMELTPNGLATTHYERQGQSLARWRSGYHRVRGANGYESPSASSPTFVQSEGELEFDANDALLFVRHEEITQANVVPGVSVRVRSLSLFERSASPASRVNEWDGPGHVVVLDRLPETAMESAPHPEDLELPRERAVEQLVTLLQQERRGQARYEFKKRLQHLLEREPALCERVATRLIASPVQESARSLVEAIAHSGSAQAAHTLLSIVVSDEAPQALRDMVFNQFILSELDVDVELLESMWRLVLAPTACKKTLFAYGRLVGAARQAQLSGAGGFAQRLVARYSEVSDGERISIVEALGNTGSIEALPLLERQLRSDSTRHRQVAVGSLRFIDDARARQLVVERFAEDEEPGVRDAAAFAMGFQPLAGAISVIERRLHEETSTNVRKGMVRMLTRHLATHPEAKRLLTQMAQGDPDEEVRERAADQLK